jgi:protein-disulfide isomerase
MSRTCWIPLLLALLAACGSTCQHEQGGEDAGAAASAETKIELPGVDTSSLTEREHATWSGYVSELLAPCPEVAVSVAQCVRDKRECPQCLPAAKFLVRQVQAGHPKEVVADVFAARFDKKRIKTIALGDSPAKGSDEPLVTVVEFADFECSACGQAFPLLEKIYKKHGKKMRFVFKHFPLESHPNAKLAAQAAYAAQLQDQFWKMHKVLFEKQDRLTEPDLIAYAQEMGLDVDRFKKDMASDESKQRVEQEKAHGETLGVDATPTIFINGRECDLTKLGSVDDLEEWIALEINLAGKKPKP